MSEVVDWSYSNINTLLQCNRKYYFSKVLATHGRKDPLRRKAYELKNMKNLTMWQGSVVDQFMEFEIIPAIVRQEDLDFDELADKAVQMAKTQFTFSEFKVYQDPTVTKEESKKEFCILDIHELEKPYTESELAAAYSNIRAAVLNIPSIKMPGGLQLITFLKNCGTLIPNVQTWHARVGDIRIKPQIDLIAYYKGKPVVIDWKLSKSLVADYSRQLIIYGLTVYLKRKETKPDEPYKLKDISLYEVNLSGGEVKEHKLTLQRVNEVMDFMTLTGSDVRQLKKLERNSGNVIDEFEITDDEVSCSFCNYRPLCAWLLLNENQYDEKSYTQFVQSSQFG